MIELSLFTRGWGGIAFIPLVLATVVFGLGIELGFPSRGDGPQTGVVLIACGIAVWLLGRRMNRGVATWREARHSFCMLPVEWYGVYLSAAGLFMLVATLVAPA